MGPPGLFRRVLGADFDQLPPVIQQVHGSAEARSWTGYAQIERGRTWLSRVLARAARLPLEAPHVWTEVRITPMPDGAETWVRRFGTSRMPSRLWAGDDGLLMERLGLLQFGFRLHASREGLDWQVVRVRLLGVLPLPPRWFADVHSGCSVDRAGRYAFQVEAVLPLAGLVVRYQGTLEPA